MTRQYLVRGRVQGVGFRWFVLKRARQLGLSGWVRNLPDGAVEVAARGESPGLEDLEGILRIGPPHARVDEVEIREISDEPELPNAFEIR